MKHQIDKGVEMYEPINGSRYPWPIMEVGDSIRFNKTATASSAAQRANDRYEPKVFKAGLDKEGAPRVWRHA
jgi:hypothetical protein